MATIDGLENMTASRLIEEIRQGGRFRMYTYCVSILVMTFRRPSKIKYVPPHASKIAAGLPFAATSFFFGWWGFPWGPIYTIGSIVTWLRGGTDLTESVLGDAERVFRQGFATPEELKTLKDIGLDLGMRRL